MTEPTTTEKAANYGAKVGENITPLLKRGDGGKFTSAGSTQDRARQIVETERQKPRAAKPTKGGRRRSAARRRAAPKKATGPKKTQQQRDQEREGKRVQRVIQRVERQDARTRDQSVKRQIRLEERRQRQAARDAEKKKRQETLATRRAAAVGARKKPASSGGGGKGGAKPRSPKPAKAPEFPATLASAAKRLQDGAELSSEDEATLVRNGLARRTREGLVLSETGLRAARQSKSASVLTTFKDAQGRPRWLSVTTTAFEDRDREVISQAAIARDVERSYKAIAEGVAEDHGPLRFWHVPGLDIGRCDFRMVAGKSLIESGTFASDRDAGMVRPGDQMSPGFLHPYTQPDAQGVYHDIVIFERSITPARRASNPWTRIQVKEYQMLTGEKEREWRERGGAPELLEALLTDQAQTEKAAEDAGVRFKEYDALVAQIDQVSQTNPDLGTALKEWLAQQIATPEPATTEKAAAPAAAVEDEEEAAEEEPEGDYDGPLFNQKDTEIMRSVFREELTPLMGLMDIEKKMGAHVQQVMGTYTAKKDDEVARLQEQLTASQTEVATLKQRLDALEGLRSRAAREHEPAPAPVLPTAKEADQPQADPVTDFFAPIFAPKTAQSIE